MTIFNNKKNIVIIDLGISNVQSVLRAFNCFEQNVKISDIFNIKLLAVCAIPISSSDFLGLALFHPHDGFEGNPVENHLLSVIYS